MEKMMENNERKWLEGVSCSPGVFTFLPVRKLLDYKSQWMGFGKQIQDTHIFHGNNHGFRYCRFSLNPFTQAKWASPSGDISPGTAFTKVQVVHLVAGCGPKQLQHVGWI